MELLLYLDIQSMLQGHFELSQFYFGKKKPQPQVPGCSYILFYFNVSASAKVYNRAATLRIYHLYVTSIYIGR
jgi:hypothetical protein